MATLDKKQKLPFGILENGKLIQKFSENPKKAAHQFFDSERKTGILNQELSELFPYKNFQKWMSEFGIKISQLKLENTGKDEEKLILMARTFEELGHYENVLKNRQEILENYNNFKPVFENTCRLKDKLEEKIKENAQKTANNLSTLLGPVLTSILIAKAKGLKNLARMPSSKIQILGAEKSLFRYLADKDKKESLPKYGIIYLSPFIKDAKKENRGKVARFLASKIMVASRLDYFSDKEEGEKLKNELI
ncbi:MAG: hypothetical protein KAU95_00310, partial [Candidatus Aenigmarchaeota archaeon]|nr:hypothetical protein [Candidatus Aenigmarchaeota archaeon]